MQYEIIGMTRATLVVARDNALRAYQAADYALREYDLAERDKLRALRRAARGVTGNVPASDPRVDMIRAYAREHISPRVQIFNNKRATCRNVKIWGHFSVDIFEKHKAAIEKLLTGTFSIKPACAKSWGFEGACSIAIDLA